MQPNRPKVKSRKAVFSKCRKYRYVLARTWSDDPLLNFVMLNPSTADLRTNDPTVERCQRYAERNGFGGVIVTNLFAFRATDPKEMKAAKNPIGPGNDKHILRAAKEAHLVICAWGNHGGFKNRSLDVMELLSDFDLAFLRLTQSGEPQHPLYLPNSLTHTFYEGNP